VLASHEERITTLEKDVVTMKHDIIYKLNDTNSVLTMIKGVVGGQGLDIKEMNGRLKRIEFRLDALEGRFGVLEGRFDALEGRVDTLDKKIDQILQLLTSKAE
jgi:predicted nuclease with TOPRIM domain